MTFNNLIVLVGLVIFVGLAFFRRQFLTLLMKIGLGGFLRQIGDSAIAKQPDIINLTRLPSPQWRDPAGMDRLVRPLVQAGFADAGTYSIPQMAGVLVQFLIKSGDNVVAQVHEHPRAGSWVEFITRFEDGTCCVLSTMSDTGLKRPGWIVTIRAGKDPTDQLYRRLVMERPKRNTKAITPDAAPREYEAGYARYIAWRKGTGMTAEEVVKAGSWTKDRKN